jgi:hypothetical protein
MQSRKQQLITDRKLGHHDIVIARRWFPASFNDYFCSVQTVLFYISLTNEERAMDIMSRVYLTSHGSMRLPGPLVSDGRSQFLVHTGKRTCAQVHFALMSATPSFFLS